MKNNWIQPRAVDGAVDALPACVAGNFMILTTFDPSISNDWIVLRNMWHP
ncbi:MAG TPA: hypothetical protein PKG49_00145 [Nitrosomonas mobilis]|nr:hypothetical protein [Nitrosomonas mobilis]